MSDPADIKTGPRPDLPDPNEPDIEILPPDAPPPEDGTRCRSRSSRLRDYLE